MPELQKTTIDLSGEWRFSLDQKGVGMDEKWAERTLADLVQLPGTTDTNQKGIKTTERYQDRLTRVWSWIAPAWYQRDIIIDKNWLTGRVVVFFERSKNCRLWINGTFVGRETTLSAPHVFDVSKYLVEGKNTISVMIDNAKLPPVGPSHAVDERTQTNWNGILGKMELRYTNPLWVDDVQAYPMVKEQKVKLHVRLGNLTGKPLAANLTIKPFSKNLNAKEWQQKIEIADAATSTEVIFDVGKDVPLWSEFQPNLISLLVKIDAEHDRWPMEDEKKVTFGMREFSQKNGKLLLNDKPVFLRGRLDCANYPLTGYAPMKVEEWRRIFQISKDWGLNHYRFHSWCPPQAAFQAADEMGIFIHAELPNKRSAFKAPDDATAAKRNIDFMLVDSVDEDVSLYDYSMREAALIFRNYGNSPSFVMFALGNELGRNQGMYELVAQFKKMESRALHAQGSNNVHWDASFAEGDDFWVTGKVAEDRLVRGAYALLDSKKGHIEFSPPSTRTDYRQAIDGVSVPVISHEIGEFQVSPDFRDIEKFTGVLEARNYQIFRERAETAGLLGQSHDFVLASGALAALCYREEIEAALRTPNFGGFQLLDLVDFPGQGTALVGMLNVFMESKGVIEPEKWREFCSSTVPLLRMDKYTWTTAETFTGDVEIAHYGENDLLQQQVKIDLLNQKNQMILEHIFPKSDYAAGGLRRVGNFHFPLDHRLINAPEKMTIRISLNDGKIVNHYPLWVYPASLPLATDEEVCIARSFTDEKTQKVLNQGGKVLLFPDLATLPRAVNGGFQCEFWSPMFAEAHKKKGVELPPGTLGLLCNPQHALFRNFPTDFHSNWQWWQMCKNSKPIVYDGAPAEFLPLVQGVDNFVRNQKLGLIAETKVGSGKLMICSIDLPRIIQYPEAKQLMHSILTYMKTDQFAPKHELGRTLLSDILR